MAQKLHMVQFWETYSFSYRNKSHKTGRDGQPFWGHVPKFPINFEEIIPCAQGNFEEQNKVLEYSIIITNYCIFIINAYYNNTYN
jgi:hypothetical protein